MIKIFNKDMILQTKLNQAFNIGYTKKMNDIWQGKFSLPLNSPKIKYVDSYYYAYIKDIGLFRITPSSTSKENRIINYEVEHVLATLLDDLMFKYHQFTNLSIKEVIEKILSFQSKEMWVLGQCDFNDIFSYKFENENLLNALLSVPKVLQEEYMWTWDTSSIPWKLNLVKAKTQVENLIHYKNNLKGLEREINPTGITTRLYGLGYGEGINQLTISDVNNGIPYLEKNVGQYGVKANTFIDKRFEDAENLKAEMERILDEVSNPKVVYNFKGNEMYKFTKQPMDKFELGNMVKIVNKDDELNIDVIDRVREIKAEKIDQSPEIEMQIGNIEGKASDDYTKLLEKQKVNDLYSQGATNIAYNDYTDNADFEHPAIIKVYLPQELVNVNKMILNYQVDKFRAYSKAIESGGGIQTTTSDGGGSTKTTNNNGKHRHKVCAFDPNGIVGGTERVYQSYGSQDGSGLAIVLKAFGNGQDIFTLGEEQDHNHDVTIEPHNHEIEQEPHEHPIKYGIYELDILPESVTVEVDGNIIPNLSLNENEVNIIPYLSNNNGKINRGWHEIKITPSSMGRITANVVSQFFIQSRGGGNY